MLFEHIKHAFYDSIVHLKILFTRLEIGFKFLNTQHFLQSGSKFSDFFAIILMNLQFILFKLFCL